MSSDKITTFPELAPLPETQASTFSPTGTGGGFASQFTGDIYTSRGRFGNGTDYVEITAQEMKSANYVSGTSGWQIKYNGDCEFNEGVFRGDVSIGSLHIPNETTASSFHTDTLGNSWWGCNVANFTADNDNANAYILNTGISKFQNITITGGSVATSTLSGLVALANENIAAQGWTMTCVFSATDADTVAWAAGAITTAAGTVYNIDAGNTGNMAATTYIYLDIAVSTTVLQATTTAATAIGSGKILVATAVNNSDATSEAQYQVFGGIGGVRLFVDNLSANLASTNEFVSNSAQLANLVVTNAKINDLAVDKLTAGTISSKAITMAVTPTAGDVYLSIGTTAPTTWTATNGILMGVDDSDSDKVKFFMGDGTTSVDWNVTTLNTLTIKGVVTITGGSGISNLSDAGALATLSVIGNAYITDLAVDKLTAGTISSKAITLAVAAGTGDAKIQAGKTDFTNTENGFILGLDDSDSDKTKFYIGDATTYFNFDGSSVVINADVSNLEVVEAGENIAAGDVVVIKNTADDTGTTIDKDTYVDSFNSGTNYGTSEHLYVGTAFTGGASNQYSYIYFPTAVSNTKQIIKAELMLYCNDEAGGAGRVIQLRNIIEAWVEGNITWNSKPVSQDVFLDYFTVNEYTADWSTDTWYAFDITEIYKFWKEGALTNYGLEMRENGGFGANEYVRFSSSDNATAANRPKIRLTYTGNSDGKAYKTDIEDYNLCRTILGVASTTATTGNDVTIIKSGKVATVADISRGRRVFISSTGTLGGTTLRERQICMGMIGTTANQLDLDIQRNRFFIKKLTVPTAGSNKDFYVLEDTQRVDITMMIDDGAGSVANGLYTVYRGEEKKISLLADGTAWVKINFENDYISFTCDAGTTYEYFDVKMYN